MTDDDRVPSLVAPPEGYAEWLADLKARVYAAQQRAASAVNAEQMSLYREIGRTVDDRIERDRWGTKVIQRLADDLRTSFPDIRGFSYTNLRYMRSFAQAWPDGDLPTVIGRLPWGHNLTLLAKLKARDERLAYAAAALEHGWSRAVLALQIEARSVERSGRAVTNFERTLPGPQSDLAREALKDPYKLDFLGLGTEAQERAIEQALVDHVAEFLVELGAGFAYVGRQVHLEVGGDDFFLDLLFYHLKLRCYVVAELKATAFKPEHLGQLGFYLSAVDGEVKHPDDGPTIGLLLCKTKNEVVAEYALRGSQGPLGIAEYDLLKNLPEPLATNLPSIEQIEAELQGDAE